MKRQGYIYDKITNLDNIKASVYKASQGKTKRKSVMKIIGDIDNYAKEVQTLLKEKKYVPSPYKEMTIHDGTTKKERVIYKPQFYPDQVIHWALMRKIEPVIRRGMYDWTCASIKGRGLHMGAKYIKRILVEDRKHTKYCLKLDIKKFYPSIDKEILKLKFRRIIKDRDVLWLIDTIIDSGKDGLPIGNYTSQWFANFYLQDLDHYIKEKLHIKYYVRYMDDMVLFSNNKKELHKVRKAVNDFLNNEHLKIKENWQLFKVDSRPLDFLGYRFYRGYTTLRRGNFLRIKRRAKRISKKPYLGFQDAAAMLSYKGWLKHCNSYQYHQKYIRPYVKYGDCKRVVAEEMKRRLNQFK